MPRTGAVADLLTLVRIPFLCSTASLVYIGDTDRNYRPSLPSILSRVLFTFTVYCPTSTQQSGRWLLGPFAKCLRIGAVADLLTRPHWFFCIATFSVLIRDTDPNYRSSLRSNSSWTLAYTYCTARPVLNDPDGGSWSHSPNTSGLAPSQIWSPSSAFPSSL